MTTVRIDSGPIEADYLLREVPQSKWRDLVSKRRDFLARRLGYDCRCLVQFVRDAEEMWEHLEYDSRDHLVRDGYGLEPEEIDLAVRWLQLNEPESAVGIGEVLARTAGERTAAAARATTGEVLPADGSVNQHTLAEGRQIAYPPPSQSSRAARSGVSPRQQRKLDALARRAPALLEEVRQGKKSCHRACVEAGIVKLPTLMEVAQRAWLKMTAEQRKAFLEWLEQQESDT